MFFPEEVKEIKKKAKVTKKVIDFKKEGCNACTLKNVKNNFPNMKPTGSDVPLLYFLGEAPGKKEDELGRQFVGDAGERLRKDMYQIIDEDFEKAYIRWNNMVRCRPYIGNSNRTPTPIEIDCCNASIVEDIERTKPLVVVGFGEVPLKNLIGGKKMYLWVNRFIPIQIGSHKCWYFVSYHPSYLVRNQRKWETEYDIYFRICLEHLFNFLNNYEEPIVETDSYDDGIEILMPTTNIQTVKNRVEYFKKQEYVAIDIETTELKPYIGKIICVALSDGKKTFSFLLNHEDLFKNLYELLITKNHKIAHNLKFELEWFLHQYKTQEFFRESYWDDTMIQAYLLDERTDKEEGMLNLDRLIFLNFGFHLKSISNVDKADIENGPVKELLLYNARDAKYTYKLFMHNETRIALDKNLVSCYNNLVETTKTLAVTQYRGVHVDAEWTEVLFSKYSDKLLALKILMNKLPEIIEFVKDGRIFNPLSPDHLIEIFRDILRLEAVKMTKPSKSYPEGQYSTDDEVLAEFSKRRIKLAKLIMEYREINKLKSTYVDNVKALAIDGIIHPQFNLLFTKTGRLSSGKE
jgi:uracil-DNA glycosylase family 4